MNFTDLKAAAVALSETAKNKNVSAESISETVIALALEFAKTYASNSENYFPPNEGRDHVVFVPEFHYIDGFSTINTFRKAQHGTYDRCRNFISALPENKRPGAMLMRLVSEDIPAHQTHKFVCAMENRDTVENFVSPKMNFHDAVEYFNDLLSKGVQKDFNIAVYRQTEISIKRK